VDRVKGKSQGGPLEREIQKSIKRRARGNKKHEISVKKARE